MEKVKIQISKKLNIVL